MAWKLYDLHTDHLGSVRIVTDELGNTVSQHEFYPFGEEVTTPLDYTTHLFTGHERDAETGLDYMFARYYGNSLSRFLSVDPDGSSARPAGPQTWNRYAYAFNNPIRYNDPNGEDGNDVANWVDRQVNTFTSFVDVNTGSGAGGVALNAAAGTAGDLVSGAADLLRVGAATGEAIGSGASGSEVLAAASTDAGRAGGLILVMTPAAGALAEAAGGAAAPEAASAAAGSSKSAGEMASDLSKQVGKNNVSASTPNGEWRIDLQGKAHGGVETPHVQQKTLHVGPNGKVNAKTSPTRPATKADVRTAKKIVERQQP